MEIFAVIPVKSRLMSTSDEDMELLVSNLESRVRDLRRVLPESFAVFTDDSQLQALARSKGWPTLERNISHEEEESVVGALMGAFDGTGCDALAWASPRTPFFGSDLMSGMLERWFSLSGEQKLRGLFAVSTLTGYLLMENQGLNFVRNDDDLSSRDLLPVEFTTLPFSIISKSFEKGRDPFLQSGFIRYEVPEISMTRVDSMADFTRARQTIGLDY